MSDYAKRYYVGRGKQTKNANMLSINLCVSDLPAQFVSEFKGKQYIKLTLMKLSSPDEKGRTHTLFVDTWKPEKREPAEGYGQTAEDMQEVENPDDIPF